MYITSQWSPVWSSLKTWENCRFFVKIVVLSTPHLNVLRFLGIFFITKYHINLRKLCGKFQLPIYIRTQWSPVWSSLKTWKNQGILVIIVVLSTPTWTYNTFWKFYWSQSIISALVSCVASFSSTSLVEPNKIQCGPVWKLVKSGDFYWKSSFYSSLSRMYNTYWKSFWIPSIISPLGSCAASFSSPSIVEPNEVQLWSICHAVH